MSMRQVEYRDNDGRLYAVMLPDGSPDSHAHMGIRVGPPAIRFGDGLMSAIAVSLHNELYHRRIYTEADARARLADVGQALRAALHRGALEIADLYAAADGDTLPPGG